MQDTSTISPSSSTLAWRASAPSHRTGISAGAKIGGPMSTRTKPPSSIVTTFSPALVITDIVVPEVSPSALANTARQRIPFPHISPTEPSELT